VVATARTPEGRRRCAAAESLALASDLEPKSKSEEEEEEGGDRHPPGPIDAGDEDRLRVLPLDVCAPFAEVQMQAEAAIALWGRIDVLVNNAGSVGREFGPSEELGYVSSAWLVLCLLLFAFCFLLFFFSLAWCCDM
jgi:NAD(P)-dependent dehydrogenase (short-subunit alcohol dehydrogenase family)